MRDRAQNLLGSSILFSCITVLFPTVVSSQATSDDLAKVSTSSAPNPNALSFQTDLFGGRFTYGIPIVVPPARQNTQPSIALGYNSSGGNGWCGVGWNLDMGYIQRENRKGVPRKWSGADPLSEYDDAKGFVVSFQGVDARLVNITGNEYRAEVDSGAFLKFTYIDPYWVVTDKNGTKFYFGETSASRMEHPNFTAGLGKSAFRWAISKISDANGNEAYFTYSKDGNQLYLSQISYNANINAPQIAATHNVNFILEDRTDQTINFQPGFRVTTQKRLKEITVKIGATKVRRYALGYSTSSCSNRSLLTTVTMYGADDTSTLPPIHLTYQVKPFEFDALSDWGPLDSQDTSDNWNNPVSRSAGGGYDDTRITLIDFNGDGLPDRVMRKKQSPYDRLKVQLNNGSGFNSLTDWSPLDSQGQTDDHWNSPESTSSDGTYTDKNVGLHDINGDGYPDRVMRKKTSPYDRYRVQLGTGSGFGAIQDWAPLDSQGVTDNHWNSVRSVSSGGGYINTRAGLFDINGDGLPDRVMRKKNSPYDKFIVQLNTGTGFDSLKNWGPLDSQTTNDNWNVPESLSAGGSYVDARVIMIDINGDGLIDRAMRKLNSPYDNLAVQLNNGAGFEPWENWGPLDSQGVTDDHWNSPAANTDTSVYDDGFVVLQDMNGDGLPDRVMRKKVAPYDRYKVQLNTGTGFGAVVDWTTLDSQGATDDHWNNVFCLSSGGGYINTIGGLFDINGDGLPDRVMRKKDAPYDKFKVQLNKGPYPDLLSTVENGIGGSVIVAYKPSTQYTNNFLPFPVTTVSSITSNDGMGNTSTTTYDYQGGFYSASLKEFRGFNKVTVTDPLGLKTITYFHQSGGTDDSANGEYQDQSSKAKKGIPYRTEVWGSDGLKYSQVLNKVEETQIHTNGWYFPFISQTITMEYEGLGSYRAVGKQFTYDTATLNLIKESNLGEVAGVDFSDHTFSDVGSDSVYVHTAYATLSNLDIKNRPSSIKITSDSFGSTKLREKLCTVYDQARGNLLEEKAWLDSPPGYVVTGFSFDQYGNLATIVDAAGLTTTTTYESTYKAFPASEVTGTFTTFFSYDARSGHVMQETDPKGLVTETTFDAFFRPTQTSISTTPNGPASLWREKISYSAGGITNGISYNYVRKQAYDPLDAANGREIYVYSDGFARTIQTRAEAETGQFRVVDTFYNNRGQPELETLPVFGNGSGFTSDQGQPGTSTEYDPIGRAFRVTPPAGDSGSPTAPGVMAFKDGTDPWVIVSTDPAGKIRKQKHDASGRVVQVIEVNGGSSYNTYFVYNRVGDLTQVTDNAGNLTAVTYDSLGRKTSITEPNTGTSTYVYDLAGRPTRQTDAKGQKLDFFYNDEIGRMTSKEIRNSSNTLVATIAYTYDSTDDPVLPVFKGQLAKIIDREGWQKFGYDFRGRVVGEKRFLNSPINQTFYTQRTYDEADRLVDLTYPTTSTVKVRYGYDTGGNLDRVESLAGTGTTEIFYDAQGFNALGQPLGVAYGNGLQTTFNYFSNSKRLQRIQTTKPGGGYHQDLSYSYDSVSNLLSITDGIYTGTASATVSSLQYDDLHRLTSLTSVAQGTKNYSYSAIGNVLTNGEFGGGTYVYGSAKPHAVTSANGKTYQYDVCGNMIDRNGTTLVYDEENQLKQYGSNITFGYAYSGQRLWKLSGSNLTIWGGGIVEFKDGKQLCHVLAEGKRIATFEPVGGGAEFMQNTPVLAEIYKGFIWLGNWPFQEGRTPLTIALMPLLGILGIASWSRRQLGQLNRRDKRLLYRRTSVFRQLVTVLLIVGLFVGTTPKAEAAIYTPVFYYYAGDHLSSSNILTDRAGDLVQHYEYTGFGKERFKDNTSAFSISNRYTGQVLDEDTGLYYYNSRYYDAELGRFIQPDTIVPGGENPQNLNRYSYVRNNPIKFVDPNGHFAFLVPIIYAAIAGAVINGAVTAINGGSASDVLRAMGVGAAQGAAYAIGAMVPGIGPWVGGALSGAVGSALNGGSGSDILRGAIVGSLSAGITSRIPLPSNVWAAGASRIGIGAAVGGASSLAMGGDFAEGAKQGALTAGISMAYQAGVNHAVKLTQNSMARQYEQRMNEIAGDGRLSIQEKAVRLEALAARAQALGLKLDIQIKLSELQLNGSERVSSAARNILEWIGPNPIFEKPIGGSDLVIRSADGLRQIRFDLSNPHGDAPHVNIETFRPRNLYPGDRKFYYIENEHVYPEQ